MAAAPHAFESPTLAAKAVSAFARLDERLASGSPGVLVVQCEADVAHAVAGHVARRLRSQARCASVYITSPSPTVPSTRALADLLELTVPGNASVTNVAAALSRALVSRHAAAVLPLPAPGSWDDAVVRELCHVASSTIVLVGTGWLDGAKSESFELDRSFSANDRTIWSSALAAELPASDLRSLDNWWAHARTRTHDDEPTIAKTSDDVDALVHWLQLVERPWRVAELGTAEQACLARAVSDSFIRVEHGYAQLTTAGQNYVAKGSRSPALSESVAEALSRLHDDPWALSTAAIRLLEAGLFDRANEMQARSVERVADPTARRQVFERWFSALDHTPDHVRHSLRIRTAERALEAGDFGDASRVTRKLVGETGAGGNDALSLLLHARAAIGMGDLTAGRVSLEQARKIADVGSLPDVLAESAELAYLEGRADDARTMANEAYEGASSASVKLRARNTLGKVLLREARWEDADAHFSEDVLFAASAGDTTAELRARCNRGMALISMNRMNEAERLLLEVRQDSERSSHPTATLYALSNLAVIALRTNRYGLALELQGQLIPLQHALRNNRALLHDFLNIALLRVKFGMYTQAEHALTFARRGIKSCALPHLQAYLDHVEALLALGRGDTVLARKHVSLAIAASSENTNKKRLADAFVLSARIALEDGDVRKALVDLEQAERNRSDDDGNADMLLVKALAARAAGSADMLLLAQDAAAAAGETGDDDRLVEAHALLAHIFRARGEASLAAAHAQRANAHRDCVIEGLGPEQGLAYSAKSTVVALGKVWSSLDAEISSEPISRSPASLARPLAASPVAVTRELVGNDASILSLRAAIRKIGRTDTTVLIRGESGTGKELVAEALHRASERTSGPLVSVNCAALVETLLLSELFGHEKGAFTGASARKRGRFELAEGGTLFLDEIGDISPKTQVALLRVLQEKTFERVGGTSAVRANVRIVCATHRDLRAMVERGEFREDLYYRLRGVTLEVPALRARIVDLPVIAQTLLERIASERLEPTPKTLSADAIDLLSRHRWPGNVRELENVLRSVTVFCDEAVVTAADLLANTDEFAAIAQAAPSSRNTLPPSADLSTLAELGEAFEAPISTASFSDEDSQLPSGEARATEVAYGQIRQGTVSLFDLKRQIERDCIARALSETKGNITKAAALLGMKRPRLSQLVKQYGLAAVEGLS